MLKKVVLSVLMLGLIGILVTGAVIRTMDKTGGTEEAYAAGGRGNAQGTSRLGGYEDRTVAGSNTDSTRLGQSRGSGQGGGNGQAIGSAERQYPNYETAPEEWMTYEGSIVQAPIDGEDLVLQMADGQQLVVGAGPGYMEKSGFALEAGEQLQVMGYWEDDEFKASQITRLRDGETFNLRDDLGRPAWSGAGRRASGQAVGSPLEGAGPAAEAPGDGLGVGLAEVGEWVTLTGTVTNLDSSVLEIQTVDGQELVIDGRTWWFAQDQGIDLEIGDQVTLLGFYEDGEFEIGKIENNRTQLVVEVREESGRPLWAGGGRRGG